MRKNIILLGLLAMMILATPVNTYAAVSFADDNKDGTYESVEDISAGQYGTIAKGDYTWRYSNTEKKEKTWTISFDTTKPFIYIALVPSYLSIDSVKVSGTGFALASQKAIEGGSTGLLIENTNKSSAELTITVITTDTSDEGCILNVSPLNLNCSVSISGFYFDNDGNAISETEYNEVCGNTTPGNPDQNPNDVPNDVPNSETGSVIPYVAIGGGLLGMAVLFMISRKSNKVFKI